MKYPVFILLLLFSCSSRIFRQEDKSKVFEFGSPEKVTVSGYSGVIMEPFISRDGHYLFFNNLNEPSVNTNIFYAERISNTLFLFKGEVQGVNSAALDAVASMDTHNNFSFVTTRSYAQNLSTIYHGNFDNGNVTAVDIVPGISKLQPGFVNFDVEISADGNTLYFVDGLFNTTGQPQTADILIATKDGTGFSRLVNSDEIFANVNTSELEYAAGISDDELTLFFTRVSSVASGFSPHIFYATRENKNAPFKRPNELIQAGDFVEAATISGDSLLYYHKKGNAEFELYCMKMK